MSRNDEQAQFQAQAPAPALRGSRASQLRAKQDDAVPRVRKDIATIGGMRT